MTASADVSLGISATAGFGNDIATLGSFTTTGNLVANSGNFTLEDDVGLTIKGPVNVAGNMTLVGPTAGGGGGRWWRRGWRQHPGAWGD